MPAPTQRPTPSSDLAARAAFRRKSGTKDVVFGLVLAAAGGVLSVLDTEFSGKLVAGIGLVVAGVLYAGWGLYKLATPPRAATGGKAAAPARSK